MKNNENYGIGEEVYISSKHFEAKLNLTEVLGVFDMPDDVAIFVDEKILPEINNNELRYDKYLKIIDGITCLGVYGKNNKLKNQELKSFILVTIDLLFDKYSHNLNGNIVHLKNNEIKVQNRAIEFLNTLNQLEMEENNKLKLFIDFILNNYEKEKEMVKKSVMLSPEHIEKIDQIEGKGFSSKMRFILDSYFSENKNIVTEKELSSGANSNILEIYNKLKNEIMSWNEGIKFKPIKDYLIFSYYYRFLKLRIYKDKIDLELSFSEDKPFEDYKAITKESDSKNKIKKISFSLNSYGDIEYALFLIKQSYENNNQDVYSYVAYTNSIHRLFNTIKIQNFPVHKKIAKNGIFVLFEKGEKFQDENRITYVSSNVKKDRIPKMLNYIFKDGNRDNTSFRKNIGRALLKKNDKKLFKKFNIKPSSKLTKLWEMDLKEFIEEYPKNSQENNQIENIEEMVSFYIQNHFSVSIIQIDDKFKRLYLKSKIISSLSLSSETKPSEDWLGHDSPREKIRKSGLWAEQHLFNRENQLNSEDIKVLKGFTKK